MEASADLKPFQDTDTTIAAQVLATQNTAWLSGVEIGTVSEALAVELSCARIAAMDCCRGDVKAQR